jgi:hypothetical protein
MSLFNSSQYTDYPAFWVQIRLQNGEGSGEGDTGFWIIMPTGAGTGLPDELGSPVWNVNTNADALTSGLPAPGGTPDTARLGSLLEAIQSWADDYDWGDGWSPEWVKVMQVNEGYTDSSPA